MAVGGYRLVVWVEGQRRTAPPPDPSATVFGSRREAAAHYRRRSAAKFGLLAPLAGRRAGDRRGAGPGGGAVRR